MRKRMVRSFVSSVLIVVLALSLVACNSKVSQVSKDQDQANASPKVTLSQSSTQGSTTALNPTGTIPGSSGAPATNVDKKTVKAKGLYLTATSAGARLQHYIDLANTTEINSYVIDYKDDDGYVCVDSKVPLAKEVKAIDVRYDAKKVVEKLHENNIYAIARIVCFKDPFLSKNKPETAIKNTSGGLYVYNQKTWVNPYNKTAWQYNIELAKEALAQGFDEIQFDYIRFPDGRKSDMVFAGKDNRQYYEVIDDFLAYARQELPNAVLSGDVFAIICESPGDTEGIGQYFEHVGKDMDYIYPMAYPSHYALGQIINGVTFNKPDLDPYGVIKNTFLKAKVRMEKVEGHKPILRAYLQDFTATWIGKGNWQYYEDNQVRQQIQAVYDAGYEEWFLWDPMNNYRENAFKKE